MNRKPPDYTEAELRRWRADMLLKQPAIEVMPGLLRGIDLVSFSLGTSAKGAYIRIVGAAGDPEIMMVLNPVVATALRDAITTSGREGGWLEEDGTVAEPILAL